MLRCVWGRACGTEEDNQECEADAVGVVAVKDDGRIHKLALCAIHRMVIVSETNPL